MSCSTVEWGGSSRTVTGDNSAKGIKAVGDGIDINGSVMMTDGILLINGPIAQMNGALDYDSSFKITGGLVVAAGSSGMAMAPSITSTQYSVLVNLRTTLSPNTLIHIQTSI
ncbi:hypothetical protein JW935_03935 [candidate division KSB1 bacterium]|nr:hypothetical protein [candidate division KSB1 bacterium]